MKRRAFIAGLCSAAAWPMIAMAQRMSVVGLLSSQPATAASLIVRAAFIEGLREGGYRIDDNLTLEYRSANFQNDRLPMLAAELVRRQVDAILASGSLEAALAAKAATTTIPIVFVNGADPVASGLVASLNKPGGNVTGVSTVIYELAPKRLGLLKELFPGVRTVALLVNTASTLADAETRELHAAARALDITLDLVAVERKEDFTEVALVLTRTKPRALIVSSDPFFTVLAGDVVELMTGCGVPAMFSQRIFPNAGGLMSYGPNLTDLYRQAGLYVAQILKGKSPGELPVLQPTKFELVINLKTAKALGLDIPPALLARADEVIE